MFFPVFSEAEYQVIRVSDPQDERQCLHMTWKKYNYTFVDSDANLTGACYDPEEYPCKVIITS